MAPTTFSHSILVVDDDPDIVLGLQDFLDHDGYRVNVAGTCADALVQARTHQYNAILLDLGLPDGDGSSVLRTLQELQPQLPVIILTAYTSADRTVGSLTQGAFAYLTKPYNRDELRAVLQRAIGVQALAAKAEYAEHALNESEARFRSLVEAATDSIVLADHQGHIISWNPAAARLFGYTDEEVRGRPLTMLMPARHRAAHERGLARVRDTGQSRLIGRLVELEGLRKDGSEFPFELSLAMWHTDDAVFYSGIIRDITQRRRAEEILDRLRHLHEVILTQAGEGIYGLDSAGMTTFVNPMAAQLLGYEPSELIEQPMHRLLHHSRPDGSSYPVDQCPIYAALHDGLVHRVSSDVFWRKDGNPVPVEYVSTPITEKGLVVGAVVVFRDITERLEAERALHDSEEFTNHILRSSADCITVLDLAGRLQYMNDAGQTLLHIQDLTSCLNQPWADFWERDDRNAALAALEAASSGDVGKFIGFCATTGGVAKWWDVRVTPMLDPQGSSSRLLAVSRDITDYRHAQESLHASEERLASVIRGSNDGFWDGHVLPGQPWHSPVTPVWWSPRVREMLGYNEQEFPDILDSWASRLHPDDREHVFDRLAACLEKDSSHYDVDYRLLTKQGDYCWFRARAEVVERNAQGLAVRMAGSLQCINDRKRAEEALHRSEELLRSVINNTTAVIYAKQADGRYLIANQRFEQLFHLAQDQIRGQTDHDIFPLAIADAFRKNDRWVLENGRPLEIEEYAPHADELHTYLSVKVPILDQAGNVIAMCGISTDITERKQAEEQLRLSEERLRMALAASDLGIWDWDVPSNRLYWSDGVEALFGLAPGSFSGTYAAYIGLIYLLDRGSVLARIELSLRDQTSIDIRHRVVWPDGAIHWLAWTGRICRNADGVATRVLGIVHDTKGRTDGYADGIRGPHP